MQSASWTATVVYLTQLLLVRSLLHDTEKCSLGKSRLPLSACHALYAILYMPFPDLCDYTKSQLSGLHGVCNGCNMIGVICHESAVC